LNVVLDSYVVSAKINIYTTDGRIISSATINSTSYTKQLNAGIYFVQVINKGIAQTTKVIVH